MMLAEKRADVMIIEAIFDPTGYKAHSSEDNAHLPEDMGSLYRLKGPPMVV